MPSAATERNGPRAATAGIESIVQFGVGAAVALTAAYLLLGIVAPLVVATIESSVPPPQHGPRSTALRIGASLGASGLTMAAVLLLVFILPEAGAALAALTIATILIIPFGLQRARTDASMPSIGSLPPPAQADRLAQPVGRIISWVAHRPWLVLPAALAFSVVAGVFALRVPAQFDVEDFFAPDTDFVTALDRVDQHVGQRGGEPALLYVEGDLTDPEQLATLQRHVSTIRQLDTDRLARNDAGVLVEGGILAVFDAIWSSPTAIAALSELSGVVPTDRNADGIPDTREQVNAILQAASQMGVPFDAQQLTLTPDDVRMSIQLDGAGSATVFELALVNSRSQESVNEARDLLNPIASTISADLGDTFVQITGSPFVRAGSLDATNRALAVSLPIALFLCLIVASLFLRSLRFGVASIVMVVTWLYGFTEVAGYAINIVTATIAAVSVGIGIDFALHYISRYREELSRHGRRDVAVTVTSEGTGNALVASALSSAVGFGIMAFAPMPLFAAYGLLTALMILMALSATLLVLPALLVLITSDTKPRVLKRPTRAGPIQS